LDGEGLKDAALPLRSMKRNRRKFAQEGAPYKLAYEVPLSATLLAVIEGR